MGKIRNGLKKLKQNRKLRCGGYSVLLTILGVALAAFVIVLTDTLEKKYAWTADFSFNAATTQSEITRTVLDELEKDVHIYAIIPPEGENSTLMQLLNRYSAASVHVTVSEETVLRNPALLDKFAAEIGEQKVNRDCLIVYCPENNRAKVLDEDDYYQLKYDLTTGQYSVGQIVYEKCITEAVLYVTGDELPVVQLLTGHGEMNTKDIADMESLLTSANYRLKWIQLGNGDVPDPESPLMILRPTYDFSDGELEKLMEYARQGGDFIFAANYNDPLDLKNYNALLRNYGVEAYPGLVIAMADDTGSYYADTPVWLMPYMQETTATLPLLESARDILVLPGARAFRILEGNGGYTRVYPVLETGRAYIRNLTDGLDTAQQQETDETGYFNVAVWTDKMFEDGTLSRALIVGNAEVFTDYWLQSNTDASYFLLQMLQSLQGKEPIRLDIVPKNALREGLKLNNIAPAVAVTALLPVLVIAGALLVLLPRKRR